ncbi:MAG: PEP-CTERM sorting domain-containing protein [Methylotenera sp.]|nr:PEP-CTERM sorting domain-containing protein [Methylotenera sp.]
MLRSFIITCLVLILPISAHATSTASIINTDCSSTLTRSLIDGASFACAGNLTLDGGFITSDSLINISADGDLFIDNLTLTAPNVTFSVLTGMLTIGSAFVVNRPTALSQVSRDSILTWSKFNIGQSAIVNFIHWQTSKTTLSRVLGTNQTPSGILTIGSGGSISLDKTIGVTLLPNITSLTPGGSIVIGSGGLITTGGGSNNPQVVLSAVPEPSTYAMILFGLSFIAFKRKTNH